jgi:hypothetical protein
MRMMARVGQQRELQISMSRGMGIRRNQSDLGPPAAAGDGFESSRKPAVPSD